MKKEPSEEALKDLFRKLRQTDEPATPSFHAILSRRPRPGAARQGRAFALALAAVAVCATLTVLAVMSRQRSSSDDEFVQALRMAHAITDWTAPTDVLLEPPHPGLVRDAPEIGGTLLDMNRSIQ